MSYLDQYEEQTGRSVLDIMRLNPNYESEWETINANYNAKDIHKVKIDGDVFTNYGDFQFIWEKSYVKSPERSGSGTIDNLNSYATFVTPHLIINFAVMSIDDYRAIMRKDLSKNEFVVECYDPIYNKKITAKMYFATPAMAKLRTIAKKRFNGEEWEDFIELVGVDGYTVEMIGTNNDIDSVSVVYHLNPPSDTGYPDEIIEDTELYKGQEILIGEYAKDFTSRTFDNRYVFTKWNINRNGGDQGKFIHNTEYSINYSLVLYAQWQRT